MPILPIVTAPSPGLRLPTNAARPHDPALRRLVRDLIDTMHDAEGLGLAAPQVGHTLRVAVVEVDGDRIVLINPEVTHRSGRQVGWEGCLSVPHFVADVARPEEVEVRGIDRHGNARRWRRTGLTARAILHEIDHLDGRLYTDLVPADAMVDVRRYPTPPAATGDASRAVAAPAAGAAR